ncbi:hypothetical protein FOB72_17550 (plasmid) [Cupriavidus pauculus]|uniref:LysR substrate-binding domain-containing protein n=1 Tax=Cupriavidus pauculus TaxID=82633 RepID=A0A5P2H8B8_9BURK|nr:hypothetical protein FOB72_17550 [Cupriavidus pauculus]
MRGHGIACVPDFAVRLHIAQGSLVELLSGNFNQGGSLSLLWPATRHPLPKVRAFVNFRFGKADKRAFRAHHAPLPWRGRQPCNFEPGMR